MGHCGEGGRRRGHACAGRQRAKCKPSSVGETRSCRYLDKLAACEAFWKRTVDWIPVILDTCAACDDAAWGGRELPSPPAFSAGLVQLDDVAGQHAARTIGHRGG